MDTVQWGMIGCGDVTEVKSAPALNRIAHSRLTAVMCRTAERAADYARRHGVPHWTTDAADLIARPDVNAVYIATPPDTHAHYTAQVAAAGKAVYVEKPMARTRGECEAMIAACAAAGVPLFVAYYRRCLPAYGKVRDLIREGALGGVRLVIVRMVRPIAPADRRSPPPWRLQPAIAGGGHFVDLAPHQLDFLDDVFGPITEVYGRAVNTAGLYPAEDLVTAQWCHETGVRGTGYWCFTGPEGHDEDHVEILGARGRLTFATFQHGVPLRLETAGQSECFRFDPLPHIQQPLLETVVAELRGQGRCPSTGRTAARTTDVIDRILATYRAG